MRRLLLLFVIPLILLSGCKNRKKEADKNYISVLALIKKQIAHVDTSLYSIIQVNSYDSLHHDTSYIPREKFSEVSKDFLAIPDLADPKVAKRYKEEPVIMDESINRAIIAYVPIEPDKENYKRQEILATPIPGADAKINNIIIVYEVSNKDSFLQKRMLWQTDKSFQIVTRSQKPGKPELTVTTRVTWNEDTEQ